MVSQFLPWAITLQCILLHTCVFVSGLFHSNCMHFFLYKCNLFLMLAIRRTCFTLPSFIILASSRGKDYTFLMSSLCSFLASCYVLALSLAHVFTALTVREQVHTHTLQWDKLLFCEFKRFQMTDRTHKILNRKAERLAFFETIPISFSSSFTAIVH
jgi:hypothetical protein